MMSDYVAPRHSAVMERLRRRIELFRRHHNGCENRYENTALERLELERQQTFALHQRCLQTKAKRSNKHRHPPQSSEQAVQRGPGTAGSNSDLGDSGTPGEQSRNNTLIALQETVKRKLDSASSPLGREHANGFTDGFPPTKKACLDNGLANGSLPPRSPLDSKLRIADSLVSNGNRITGGHPSDGARAAEHHHHHPNHHNHDFRLKEMKQEPDDILPCMLPPGGGGATNSLFPDLNLNEQEWTELMDELNRSVPYEDIQDILNDGFEDRRDTPDTPAARPGPVAAGGPAGGSSGGGGGAAGGQGTPGQQNPVLMHPDLGSVKAEFTPVSAAAFEHESCTGPPPHVVRSTSSGPPPLPTSSPVTTSSAPSPALPGHAPPGRQLLPPGAQVSKDLSPAQQLQQLAAQQQRAQHLHNQLQHKQQQHQQQHQQQQHQQQQQQQQAKFHPHPPSWPQAANPSQSPLGGAFAMDKPSSPSLYPNDFNPNAPKQLLMPGQPNKGSPKAGAGGYMQGPGAHPNMLAHPSSGAPLGHPPAASAQATAAMLSYNNTKPLSHFEASGPGPAGTRGPPNTQNKAVLLSFLRQQQTKQKAGMSFRPHLPHPQQDQNPYPSSPHGPTSTMAAMQGGGAMATPTGGNSMTGNHGNASYLSNQAAVAAALKQQQQQHQQQQHQQHQQQQQHHQQQQMQLMEQQKQYMLGQRQLLAEQEKQRQQQDQQLQRHLTRPPPQYQDQAGQTTGQNPFQQQVNQFSASSQPMGGVGPQRMFAQNQGMMGMSLGGQGGGPGGSVPPLPAASQTDLSLPSCGGGGALNVQQVLYNSMTMHPSHPAHPAQQGSIQRQPLSPMSATYRHSLLAQQQHLKNQPNAALLKQQQQQQLAPRPPGAMAAGMGASMPGPLQSVQSQAWQQQQALGLQQALGSQPSSSNGGGLPPAFSNPSIPFQMQQPRMPKMASGAAPFGAPPSGGGGRPLGGQQMMQGNMAAAQQTQQQQGVQGQPMLPDLGGFGQPQGSGRPGLQCNQGYQVSRTLNQQQQQQQLSFGYGSGGPSGSGGLPSFPGESDLVDSLLKGQSTQEWMDDLDELLAGHHCSDAHP